MNNKEMKGYFSSHEMNLYGKGWQQNGVLYATTTLLRKGGTIEENIHWPMKVFFTATRKFAGFDCDRTLFIGDGRTGANPVGSGKNKEGEIFINSQSWAIMALAMIGSEKAYQYYQNSLFINTAQDGRYKAEPYVYPEIISGPDSPHYGEGMRGWLTGCAAWFFRACTDYILGIRPEYEGLLIDPCINHEWKEYSVVRTFWDRIIYITVKNPERIYQGVKMMLLNGRKINFNFGPFQYLQDKNTLKVVLGKSSRTSTGKGTRI